MKDWIKNQLQNSFLYIPFLMAFGAGIYFCSTTEIKILYSICLFIISCIGIGYNKTPVLLRGICFLVFGFCYASLFTHTINTPRIPHHTNANELIGIVTNIDFSNDKNKILLTVNGQDINTVDKPVIIRLSVNPDISLPDIGDTIQFNGTVYKPSVANAPGTFDFARWTYFNHITATGYADKITVINTSDTKTINTLRNFLHNKSESFLTDTLVLGYKSAIPEQDQEIWKSTGVGHIWSISGFHITLVGGWIFAIIYLIFRSIPYITKRIPARIPAIIITWFGLLFYLFLSGSDVATIRAFIMTSLAFIAFIFGRSVISVRNVALAFCLIFLINPHYVMQAGFQLSFSAVFGLVWLYTDVKPKMPKNKFIKIIYAMLLTTFVATIFTAPFIAAHFGQIPTYSLLGNMIFLPIFSFAIMPLIMIGTVCAIFNIMFPIHFAHSIYDFAYSIAIWISELPMANIYTPYISNTNLTLFIIGFIFLILVKNNKIKLNYILFIMFICMGIIGIYIEHKPVFYSTYDTELVGFVKPDGHLEFNKARSSKHYFAFNTWKQINGEPTDTKNIRAKHTHGVYRYNTEKFNLVYILKFTSLMNNISQLCNDDNVDFIVSYHDIKSKHCGHKILQGGFVIYPNGDITYIPRKRKWN